EDSVEARKYGDALSMQLGSFARRLCSLVRDVALFVPPVLVLNSRSPAAAFTDEITQPSRMEAGSTRAEKALKGTTQYEYW
ncbi:unnamed protein product, partial [Amoebophrya sp. A25]